MMNNLVSVIVPVYNKEKTLNKSVNSILQQTYHNIEIILINDGSTDNSFKICEALAKKDGRIKILDEENKGVSIARNRGIEFSNGSYLTFVDPDDELSPWFIEKMLNVSLKNDCDISICCAFVVDENIKYKNSFFNEFDDLISKKRAIAQLYSNSYFKDADNFIDVGVPWAKLYKKSFIMEKGIKFHPKLRRMQDNVFNLLAFNESNKLYYIDEPLYYYSLENFKTSKYRYIKDADILFLDVAKEMYKIYLKYSEKDPLLEKLMNQRLFSLLLITFRNKVCHPELEISDRNRIEFIKKLSLNPVYRKVIDSLEYNHLNHESKLILMFSRSVLSNLKKEKYRPIVFMYNLYFKLGFKLGVLN